MKSNRPTKKQAAILKYIEDYSEEYQRSPSYREIMQGLNLRSVSAVAEHISNCEKAGFLEKVPGQARSLRIIPLETHEETIKLFARNFEELNQRLAEVTEQRQQLELGQGSFAIGAVSYNGSGEQQLSANEADKQKRLKSLDKKAEVIQRQIKTLNEAFEILGLSFPEDN